jgi:hypothetical protein
VILYGSKTWSLTLRDEHRLRVSENRVLRRIIKLKRDEVIAGVRKLHTEELHNLYCLPMYNYNNYNYTVKEHNIVRSDHVA